MDGVKVALGNIGMTISYCTWPGGGRAKRIYVNLVELFWKVMPATSNIYRWLKVRSRAGGSVRGNYARHCCLSKHLYPEMNFMQTISPSSSVIIKKNDL